MPHFGQQAAHLLTLLRHKKPLIHHITNFVVMNDTANMTLHIGALPVMAHAKNEVEEMVNLSQVLVLNPGTLEDDWIDAMVLAGKQANKKGIPIVHDPVGTGATQYRTTMNQKLLKELNITVLRGNAGEISTLGGIPSTMRGVESTNHIEDTKTLCSQVAQKYYHLTVAITGQRDIISDGHTTYMVNNGHSWLQTLTGTGCMSTTVVAAFVAVAPDPTFATAAALASYGLAANLAAPKASGPASFKTAFLDAIYNLTEEDIIRYAKITQV